ncbi:acyl carrier protein [Streptomyces sp. NPDC007325]|uniref:acyl carrier protein n=1 Tax=Streptomyces sp. NPDC007325 TaxID=3154588 RepID=UPI0033DF7311
MDLADPVFDRARTVLIDVFDVPADSIRPDATLEELELDSLAIAELAFAIDDEFGVRLHPGDATKRSTLAEIADLLRAHTPLGPDPRPLPEEADSAAHR